MKNKLEVFFLFLLIAFVLLSCSSDAGKNMPTFNFEKTAFDSSKSLWNDNNLKNYSFEYEIHNGGGTVIIATTTVTDGKSDVSIKTMYNVKYEDYPKEYKEDAINGLVECGYYFNSIDVLYACIDKIYQSCIERIEKYPEDINSVTLSIKYNNDGVPILVDTIWDSKQDLIGLCGPKIIINRFSKSVLGN